MLLLSRGCYGHIFDKVRKLLSEVMKVGRMEMDGQCIRFMELIKACVEPIE
jgi:hypothetical protein